MTYFLVDGNAPEGAISGEEGISFDPGDLRIVPSARGWELQDGERTVVTCPQVQEAHRAFDIILDHGFTKKCWVKEPDGAMTYFRK